MFERILTMAQLEERLAYWQQRLKIQDWGIELAIVRGYELGEYTAKINVMDDKRRARIRMLDPNDYNPDLILPYDMEQVLVHELLHIHFWPLTKNQGCDLVPEEQAIEAISWGLIGMADQIRGLLVDLETKDVQITAIKGATP